MTESVQNLLVRRTIRIEAPPSHVFEVFVTRLDTWWPRSHHIGASAEFEAKIEPREGGRWYEVGADGKECEWGRVLTWEPPRRIVLSWEISATWQHDPSVANEVEVRFHPDGEQATLVELEHRKLERYGEHAPAMYGAFASEQGWSGILESLAAVAKQSAPGT